jgi:hypothetical protein
MKEVHTYNMYLGTEVVHLSSHSLSVLLSLTLLVLIDAIDGD